MKKVYVVVALLLVASLSWCTLKWPKIPAASTGDIETISWTTQNISWALETTWSQENIQTPTSVMEEYTWTTEDEETSVAPTTTTSTTTTSTKISEEEAQPASKNDKGLTEEDIDLMEDIISQVQNLGK